MRIQRKAVVCRGEIEMVLNCLLVYQLGVVQQAILLLLLGIPIDLL